MPDSAFVASMWHGLEHLCEVKAPKVCIRDQFKKRLDATGCLVVYDGERRYRDCVLALAAAPQALNSMRAQGRMGK